MSEITVALAGNPNVGKSTLFNRLTGMQQHTGNWAGKTVGTAQGVLKEHKHCLVVDLPGMYSLECTSQDEQIAADYLTSLEADCVVAVCDAGCLERTLILVLQLLPLCPRLILCVNLVDEAKRNGLILNKRKLETIVEVPVVFTCAGNGSGVPELTEQILRLAEQPPQLRTHIFPDPVKDAEHIAQLVAVRTDDSRIKFLRQIDQLMVSRRFGVPFLFLLLVGILWVTVSGANYPGMLLEILLDQGYQILSWFLAGLPWWLKGVLLDGVYATCARVISVMLPPVAIFFPLFTLLEDIGYLPRMAFLLDPCMARCGGCGKQALTLCMGLGCNAVGVMGCRIIDSPGERLRAILTNAMIPCNGRFPALILLGSLFFPDAGAAFVVAACVALGVAGAMAVSGLLTGTVVKDCSGTFLMEMPPFRRPRLGQILVRSLKDRVLFVASRALAVAAPAGAILWIFANTHLLAALYGLLDPMGLLLGMNGMILLAFLMSLPANELMIPVLLMALTGTGTLQSTAADNHILLNAMTWQMGLCTMVFTVFHWPCSTTLMTVYRETKSMKKTAAAFLLPTAVGCILCIMLNLVLKNICG